MPVAAMRGHGDRSFDREEENERRHHDSAGPSYDR
jgi:hypothetical protein